VFTLSGGPITWCSKKKDCIALSTMEAEYVACSIATHEAIWLRSLLQDLNLTPKADDPIELLFDNTTAIQFAKNSKFHRKTKHIKGHYHFMQDAIKSKEIAIKHISTNKMIANPLTKPIPKDVFKSHMLSLGLRRV